MTISKIKKYKNKVTLILSNGEKLDLSMESYPNFYLYEGKEISPKELKQIKDSQEVMKLLSIALKAREKKLYSEYKMRELLYKNNASKKSVDQVIKMLKGYDLIDDKAFVEEYVSYYNEKNYGKNKIIKKLNEKGIFSDVTDKIKFPYNNEIKKANNVLKTLEKQYSKYNNAEKKKHIYSALISRGFDNEVALQVSNNVKESTDKEEAQKLSKEFDKAYSRYKNKYEKRELKSKIVTYLLSKGYKYNDILAEMNRRGI